MPLDFCWLSWWVGWQVLLVFTLKAAQRINFGTGVPQFLIRQRVGDLLGVSHAGDVEDECVLIAAS